MDLNTIAFIALAAFAVFVQAVAGFGGTLLAMPLGIMLLGVDTTKPVMTIIAWLTGVAVAVADFKYINWRELGKMALVMLAGMALGLWAFGSLNMKFLLIIYAVVVLGIGVKKLFFPAKGEKKTHPAVQGAALGVAGVMQGMFVSGGSFLVVYAVARMKDKREFRATVNAVWAVLNIALIISYWVGGTLTGGVLTLAAWCVVPTALAVWLGGLLAKRIKQEVFLKVAYAILIASGAVLLISNL